MRCALDREIYFEDRIGRATLSAAGAAALAIPAPVPRASVHLDFVNAGTIGGFLRNTCHVDVVLSNRQTTYTVTLLHVQVEFAGSPGISSLCHLHSSGHRLCLIL